MEGLIIDTSSSGALIAHIQGDTILSKICLPDTKQLTEKLFPLLKDFCDFSTLDFIAVGTGPGSFIGLRTAAAIGATLAFALTIPVLSFPSPLLNLPLNLEGSFTVVGDAKMGKLFQMDVELSQDKVVVTHPPQLVDDHKTLKSMIDLRDQAIESHLEYVQKFIGNRCHEPSISNDISPSYLHAL